jgi:hypothetical protein
MSTSIYYLDNHGNKIYLPEGVEIHCIKGNGGELIVSSKGQSYISLTIHDTKNKLSISPINSNTIEVF